jgi:type II secretory pathway pseudopilin PulG
MKQRLQSGFTTVEIVVAITVFGVLIPTFGAALNNLTLINNRARDLALANMLAQNKVELLRGAGYNSISLGTTDFSAELPSVLASPKSASYAVSSPSAGIKEVQVTISYQEYSANRSIQYKSIISELGVGQ